MTEMTPDAKPASGLSLSAGDDTLGRIEAGAGDDYVPTVQVLTRSGLRRLFGQFRVESVRTAGVMPDDFLHLQVVARKIHRATFERLLRWVGWYLVITAERPMASKEER